MGRNRDVVDPNRQAQTLESFGVPSNPAERKQFEAEQRRQLEERTRQAQQNMPQGSPENTAGGGFNSVPQGQKRVFLVNNKARELHIPDEGHVFHGQLAVSAKGPFLIIGEDDFNRSYQLQTYLEKPLSTTNPYLAGKTQVERLTEEEYRKRFAEYQKGKSVREAEYAKVGNPTGTHSDGTLDEFDAANEVRRINPKILRAQS